MKKSVMAAALAGVMLLSGCSGVSQESSSSAIGENSSVQTDNGSSSTVTSSSANETSEGDTSDNKELEQKFDEKCEQLIEHFSSVMPNTQFNEPSVQYENSDICVSKLYVLKNDDYEDDRILMAFLDIYTDDEYEFFQTTKGFISFVEENVLEISGRNQFMISINPELDGASSISISCDDNGSSIIYADRSTRSAYSERLKSLDLLKECDEQLSLPGLVKFDDLPKNCISYDITCEYQGKTLTHKWYKLDDGKDDHNYVTYIDDGTYDDMTDEELLCYAYSALFDDQNELGTFSNKFYFTYKSGEEMVCSIYFYPSEFLRENTSCHWLGKYEHLNSNTLNIKLLNTLKGQTE